MARLGHRQPNVVSKRTVPIVVGPIAILTKPKALLAVDITRRVEHPQYRTRSLSRKPFVGPIVVLPAPKTRLAVMATRSELAPQRVVRSLLRKPAVIQAPVVPSGLTATSDISATVMPLRGVTPAAINASSNISGSVSTSGPPSPLQAGTTVVLAGRHRSGHWRLGAPAIISPASAAPPAPVVLEPTARLVAVQTRQDWQRRRVQSLLRPPTVIAQPSSQVPLSQLRPRTKLAPQPRRQPVRAGMVAPAIVNPTVLLRVQLVPDTTLNAVATRQSFARRHPFSSQATPIQTTSIPRAVQPTGINATSNITAAVTDVAAITGAIIATSAITATVGRVEHLVAAINATSTVSGAVVRIVAITGAINATSNISALVTGGTATTTVPQRMMMRVGT